MAEQLLLGVDVGTYETKGVLVTPHGEVRATAVRPHKLLFPRAGWAEHDPEETWWGDVVFVIRQLLATDGVSADQVAGVGISAIGPDVLPRTMLSSINTIRLPSRLSESGLNLS